MLSLLPDLCLVFCAFWVLTTGLWWSLTRTLTLWSRRSDCQTCAQRRHLYVEDYIFKWAIHCLFFVYFRLYKQTIQIQRQINVGSVPSRKVQCRFEGSDVTPFVHLNGTLKIYSPDGGECLDDGSMVTSMLRPDGIWPSRLSCSGFRSLPAAEKMMLLVIPWNVNVK